MKISKIFAIIWWGVWGLYMLVDSWHFLSMKWGKFLLATGLCFGWLTMMVGKKLWDV